MGSAAATARPAVFRSKKTYAPSIAIAPTLKLIDPGPAVGQDEAETQTGNQSAETEAEQNEEEELRHGDEPGGTGSRPRPGGGGGGGGGGGTGCRLVRRRLHPLTVGHVGPLTVAVIREQAHSEVRQVHQPRDRPVLDAWGRSSGRRRWWPAAPKRSAAGVAAAPPALLRARAAVSIAANVSCALPPTFVLGGA